MPKFAFKSIWDDDTPESIRARARKGLDAWDRAQSSEDDAVRMNELRDAYSHLRMAHREAKGGQYGEIIYFGDVAALMTGEFRKWPDRLKAFKEAYEVCRDRNEWLLLLFANIVEDVTGIKLAPSRARQQLWADADKHSDFSFGATMLGNVAMQMFVLPPALKRQYGGLAHEMSRQIITNLEASIADGPSDSNQQAMPFAVEALADAMAEEEHARVFAAELYRGLASLPEEVWTHPEADETGRSPQAHRDHAEARSTLAAARGGGGCGVLAVAVACVVAMACAAIAWRGGPVRSGGH